MPAADLVVVNLESPLPASLPAGTVVALYCSGTASAGGEPVAGLDLVVDGVARPADATGMPRFDVTPRRSGFWSVVPVRALGGEPISLAARVRCLDGSEADVALGQIRVGVAPAPPSARTAGGGVIAICMATFDPPGALLRAQLDSLRAQSDENWTCVISDDCSSPEGYAQLLSAVSGDERFVVSRSEQRIGFYRNFERALAMAPPEASLIALCDQDDVWHPDKLAVLRAHLGSAELVYSDQRLLDDHGRVLRETLWEGRANNSINLASMLIANTVTGAATLLRRSVAEAALPFPDSPGIEFHDHWMALVALAGGDLAYVDAPLYDYIQHGEAILGKVAGSSLRRDWTAPWRMREWRAAYFLGYVPGQIRARTLLLRCAEQLTPAKRRTLERYLACDTSLRALLWLVVRPLRAVRGHTETLGGEWEIARGVLWHRLARAVAGVPGWPDRLLLDCRFPDPPSWRQKRLERWRGRI